MSKVPTFEQFKRTFSKASGKPERRFYENFGDVSFEDAYKVYYARIAKVFDRSSKIAAFEQYLISKGVEYVNSNISESRYYYYNGVKYRFSNHVYPTGSMSDSTLPTVDFAAEPHLIDDINF